jgi:O-antigen/teichoic acid export membrane protein
VQILIPLFFFQFIANALSPAFILLERTRALCIVQAILLCATLFPFMLGPMVSETPYFVLGLYSGAQALAYFVYCWALCYVTEISIRDLVARSWLALSSLWRK